MFRTLPSLLTTLKLSTVRLSGHSRFFRASPAVAKPSRSGDSMLPLKVMTAKKIEELQHQAAWLTCERQIIKDALSSEYKNLPVDDINILISTNEKSSDCEPQNEVVAKIKR